MQDHERAYALGVALHQNRHYHEAALRFEEAEAWGQASTCWRLAALELPAGQRAEGDLWLRRARRLVRRALAQGNAPGHAWREAAFLAALRGHPHRTREALVRSVEAAPQEAQQTEQARTEIGQMLAGDSAGAIVQVPPAPAMAHPLWALLPLARRLSGALDADRLWDTVHEVGTTLLRGTSCSVFVGSRLRRVRGTEDLPSIDKVRQAGETFVLQEGDSTVGICAPILVEDVTVACFLVFQPTPEEDDLAVASLVATLASAALENIRAMEDRIAHGRPRGEP
ncbi:MAG TPA: hypothetical protein VGO93_27310 [Candidatus Xenobia bacterium]|jgi:hypothetical protein